MNTERNLAADSNTRRSFLKTTAAATAASLLTSAHTSNAVASSEKLRIGLIGCGNRMSQLIRKTNGIDGVWSKVQIVAISEVFDRFEHETQNAVEKYSGTRPEAYHDYRDLLKLEGVDAVIIATPDHWHGRQTLDALKAGKHVYCEKPMTHTLDEAFAVLDAWRSSGLVMQVGVQSTSLPAVDRMRAMIDDGKLGKVLQYQTEYFRNTNFGQTRQHELTADMTPKSIDWRRWLGLDEGLCPDAPFDRAVFRQWRCYWAYSSGMLTDLFVHRLTAMLKATGLRYPGRVVTGGGIYLEYDNREVPDLATTTIDYHEGVQGLIMGTMDADATRIPQVIRGHFGSFVLENGEQYGKVDFVPERPQVTLTNKPKAETIEVGAPSDTVSAHLDNFFEAARAGKPELCNNTPDLGAAAVVTVLLSRESYRKGKAYLYDPERRTVTEDDGSWARRWEKMSKNRAKPHHVPGWHAGDYGSTIKPPEYMKLAGPWIDGKPPQ
jgi:predicted dehydrogenase